MNKDSIYAATCIMCIVFVIAYLSVPIFSISLPRYYPLTDEWKTVKEKGVPSMGWYAMTIFALLISSIITILSYLYLRSIKLSRRIYTLLTISALVFLIIFMIFFAQHEYFHWIIKSV